MERPLLFGKYCLLERVSVGGMAEVFRAKPFGAPEVQQFLALKRILPHLAEDEEFIQMFVDEAKLTVMLKHPNVVQTYELGQFQSSFYILMDYIAGHDVLELQRRIRQARVAMDVAQACFIAQGMASGMDYAHRCRDPQGRPLNIIHRDISPQNVLISYAGEVKIIDFGVAKASGQSTRTQAGVLKGKFSYMSPEQVRGELIDHRSDLFAIGVVLWEMLTNRRLFRGDNEFATMQMIRDPRIEPPSTYNDQIPPEVDRIALKALAVERDQRYSCGADIARDIAAWLDSQGGYGRRELAQWMEGTFAEEVRSERDKQGRFEHIRTPEDVMRYGVLPTGGNAPAGRWAAAQVWDVPEAPPDDEDPLAFAAQHTKVAAGGFDPAMMGRPPVAATPPAPVHLREAPSRQPSQRRTQAHEDDAMRAALPASQNTQPRYRLPEAAHVAEDLPAPAPVGSPLVMVVAIVLVLAASTLSVAVAIQLAASWDATEATPPVPPTMVVHVSPPGEVEILVDGKLVGQQGPAAVGGLTPGRHTLEVRGGDFHTHVSNVQLGEEGVVAVRVTLTPRLIRP